MEIMCPFVAFRLMKRPSVGLRIELKRMRETLFKSFLPLVLAAVLPFAVRAEKSNVFFVHGANVSLEEEQAWASAMFKRFWQTGAHMNFFPVC